MSRQQLISTHGGAKAVRGTMKMKIHAEKGLEDNRVLVRDISCYCSVAFKAVHSVKAGEKKQLPTLLKCWSRNPPMDRNRR